MMTTQQKPQTYLSNRIPRDSEHERYHPELEEELKECLFCLHRNEMMFDLEVDTDPDRTAHLRASGAVVPLPVLTGQSAGAGAPHDFEKIPALRMMEHIPAFCDKNLDIG